MNLYKVLDDDRSGEPQEKLMRSSEDVDDLKDIGRELCREDGIEDAVWVESTASWQELSVDGKIYYFIRP